MGFRRRRWRDVKPDEEKVRVNFRIRVPEVRVVNEDGQQLGVMATEAARDIAARIGLDLVEISPNGKPPVCKIMDYGRYKYELKKKASSARKTQHQSHLKEVKLRPQIDEHDLAFKVNNARRFLIEGDKVKTTVMFRGREIVHSQLGRNLLDQVVERLEGVAKAESSPQMEGRTLSMILAPDRDGIKRIKREEAAAAKAAAAVEDVAQGAEDAVPDAEDAVQEEGGAVEDGPSATAEGEQPASAGKAGSA